MSPRDYVAMVYADPALAKNDQRRALHAMLKQYVGQVGPALAFSARLNVERPGCRFGFRVTHVQSEVLLIYDREIVIRHAVDLRAVSRQRIAEAQSDRRQDEMNLAEMRATPQDDETRQLISEIRANIRVLTESIKDFGRIAKLCD